MNFNIFLESTIKSEQVDGVNEIVRLSKGVLDISSLLTWMGNYPSIVDVLDVQFNQGLYSSFIIVADKVTKEKILTITKK